MEQDHLAQRGGHTRVRFDRPGEIRVSVTFNLYVSVFALICDEVSQQGSPAARTRAAQAVASLPAPARDAVTPVVAPGHSLCPDCLSPTDPTQDTELGTEVERLRSLTAEEVRRDLEDTFAGSSMPEHWQRVWDRPRRWARNFASAVERVGAVFEPEWRASAELRDREVARIGAAVLRGVPDVALANAHPRGKLVGTVLEFPDEEPIELDTSGRKLVLTPMIGQPRTAPCNLDWPSVVWFGYPLPTRSYHSAREATGSDELDALLTPMRARLLRVLDTEYSMYELSRMLLCSAPTTTHHCNQLAKAGLVQRRREGKTVLVSRTSRGEEILDVYAARAYGP